MQALPRHSAGLTTVSTMGEFSGIVTCSSGFMPQFSETLLSSLPKPMIEYSSPIDIGKALFEAYAANRAFPISIGDEYSIIGFGKDDNSVSENCGMNPELHVTIPENSPMVETVVRPAECLGKACMCLYKD